VPFTGFNLRRYNAGDFTKVNWMRAARTDKGVSAVVGLRTRLPSIA
jgi:tRNA U38,U39,U40 pseudouridine synthase TruA